MIERSNFVTNLNSLKGILIFEDTFKEIAQRKIPWANLVNSSTPIDIKLINFFKTANM